MRRKAVLGTDDNDSGMLYAVGDPSQWRRAGGVGAKKVGDDSLDLVAEREEAAQGGLGLVHLGRRYHLHGSGDFL